MTVRERWYSSITLILAILPAIVVAVVQSFVDYSFVLENAVSGTKRTFSFYQMNFVSIFCIVPFAIVSGARLLRNRDIIGSHFSVVITATLLMTLVYVGVIMWILYGTLKRYDAMFAITNIDYISLSCAVISLAFCLLSNFLPQLPPNPIFGVKNKWTASDPSLWIKVNAAAASAITYLFLICALLCAYSHGAMSIIWPVVSIFVYYLFVSVYSYRTHKKFREQSRYDDAAM